MTTPRIIAIGDIHGCALALGALLEAIEPRADDTIVTLGDYVDRGSDSSGVITELIDLASRCRLVPLLGNHEDIMLRARDNPRLVEAWFRAGGQATLDSYDATDASQVPAEHWRFISSCKLWFQTTGHIFVHAGYDPALPLHRQHRRTLLWASLNDAVPGPHCSGKVAIVGHTPQKDGRIFELSYLKCIDTDCCRDGWLTALDVTSGQVWQANDRGIPATPPETPH